MSDEGTVLALAVQDTRSPGGRYRYSDGLKARVAAYWRGRRREGALATDVAKVLGLHPVQLCEWSRRFPESSFRPVRVVDDRPHMGPLQPGAFAPISTPAATQSTLPATSVVTRPDSGFDGGLSLVSPGGWRIEGLDPTLLIQLIEKLS